LLAMIRFEHTLFALPFALMGMLLAADGRPYGLPTAAQFGWILVAMVGARSSAMAFNRIADLRFDRGEPAHRRLGAGERRGHRRRRLGPLVCCRQESSCCGRDAQPPRLRAVAGGARHHLGLLVHQAIHRLVASRSRAGVGSRAGGGLGRRQGNGSACLPSSLSAAVILWVAGSTSSMPCRISSSTGRSACIRCRAGTEYGFALGLSSLLHAAMVGMLVACASWRRWARCTWRASGVALFLIYEHRLVRPMT